MLPHKDDNQKESDMDCMKGIPVILTQTDILQLAESSTLRENILSLSEENLTESMMNSCGDVECESKQDSYILDNYPTVAKQLHYQRSSLDDNIQAVSQGSHNGSEEYNFDSILSQFDSFFRRKLDAELHTFHDCMHSLLSEQRIHIQKILSSVATVDIPTSGNAHEEIFLSSVSDVKSHASYPPALVSSAEDLERNDGSRCTCHDNDSKARMNVTVELLSGEYSRRSKRAHKMDAADIDLDLDSNFEPQTRARSNTWPLRPSRELEPQSSPVAGDESSNGGEQPNNVKDPLGLTAKKSGSRRNAWGNLSYADLITKAIQSSPEKRLTLSQIYDWMVQNVPYFKDKGDSTSSAGWKNSIRHNLSLHSRFMRIQNEGTGKSSWWVLNPDAKPGKTPRRRAGSMETKSYEKKRGRVRKKVEALRAAMENGGTLSPGGSDDYLDAISFGDFRSRASSNASSCGRLSPIHAVAEPDLHDNQVPPMSPIPWGTEVSNSPTMYSADGYSDLVDSLVDGIKLTSQDSLKMDMVTGLRDPYLSGTTRDFNNQSSTFLSIDHSPSGLDSQFSHLPAPPPYPKQQKQQMNGLEFPRQNYNNPLQLQCRSSPVSNGPTTFTQTDIFSDDYNETVLNIKQEAEGMSPVRMATPNSLSVNTQQQLSSPDRSQQGSPSSGTFTSHLSPQTQSGLVNGHSLSPLTLQVSPQQGRHLIQQQPNTTASMQQQQQALQQATQASILREALTRGPPAYRSHSTTNSPTPTFSPLGNQSPLGSAPTSSNINNSMLGIGLTHNSNVSPRHQSLSSGHLRSISENFTDNHIITSNSVGLVSNNNPGVPLDIDMDLISGLDYDMDQVIKQELTLEGNLDFNFDSGPPTTSVGQNAVH